MEDRLLWKHNKTQSGDEIPMWKTDYCGNAMKPKSMMKFQCGKYTIVENAIKLKSVVKFQCGKQIIV